MFKSCFPASFASAGVGKLLKFLLISVYCYVFAELVLQKNEQIWCKKNKCNVWIGLPALTGDKYIFLGLSVRAWWRPLPY